MNYSYSSSELMNFFHSIPRLSFRSIFANSPRNFSLKDMNYVEGLLTTALIPASLLFLTMIGFLLFYCCIKFQHDPIKNNKPKRFCSTCLIIFFVCIVLCGLGSTIYGSIFIRKGIVNTMRTLSEIIRSLSVIGFDLRNLHILSNVIKVQSVSLKKKISDNNTLSEVLNFSNALVEVIFYFPSRTEDLAESLKSVLNQIQLADKFRFMITYSLIGFTGLVCFVAIIGVGFRSRCCLISMSLMGHLCLIGTFLYITFFFVIGIGIADMCIDPISLIEKESVGKLSIKNVTFRYYLNCNINDSVKIPFRDVVLQAKNTLIILQGSLKNIPKHALLQNAENVLLDLEHNCNELMLKLESIQVDFVCNKFNVPIKKFVSSLCSTVFIGLFVNIISMLCVCLALSFMLCAAPKAWKNCEKSESDNRIENVTLSTPITHQARAWHDSNPHYFQTSENLVLGASRSALASYTKKVPTRSTEDRIGRPPPYSQHE